MFALQGAEVALKGLDTAGATCCDSRPPEPNEEGLR
jgi:hypothetical protein